MKIQVSNLKRSLALAAILGCVIQPQEVVAQPVPTVTPIPVVGLSSQGYYTAGTGPNSYFYWVDEAWTANDKSFVAIETQVQSLLRPQANKKVVWQRLRREALAQPLNAKAQYRWAYAAFLIFSRRWQSGQDERWVFPGVREAMEKPKPPHSYRYTRIRMFINEWDRAWATRAMSYIRKCAFRLLDRNPNDEAIKYAFSFDLSLTSNTVKEQDLAYKWAQEYLAKYPNRPQAYYIIGSVLGNRFTRSQASPMAQQAIYYLRKCQRMLPKDHYYQGRSSQQIANVNEATELFQRKGMLRP